MATQSDYTIDVDYGPRDKYGKSEQDYKTLLASVDAERDRQKQAFAELPKFETKPLKVNPIDQAIAEETPKAKKDVIDEAIAGSTESGDSTLMKVLKFGRGMTLPTAGSMLGTGLGTAFGPPGILIGESLGSGGGELLSQALGWSEPSKGAVIAAMAGGPLGRTLKPLFRFGRAAAVSTLGGRALVSEGAESLLKKELAPGVASKILYDTAEKSGKSIPYNLTKIAVDDVVQKELAQLPTQTRREVLKSFAPMMRALNIGQQQGRKGFQLIKSAPVQNAMAEVRRLGLDARNAFYSDKADVGNAINKVRAAVLDDLERAGVPEVKAASKAFRKEMAIEDLSRMLAKPQPGVKLRDFARDNPLFKGAFTPGEKAQFDRIVKKLEFVTPSGSAGVMGKTIVTGIGTALGEMLGIPVAGGAATFLGSEAFRHLLTTAYGRGVIERTLSTNVAELGPKEIAVLASTARAMMGSYLDQQKNSAENE